MEFLCKVCDRLNNENESEYNNHLATLRKKDDTRLYEKYTINIINFDEVIKNKRLNLYS